MKINTFKLERYFAQYEFKAPYLLCTSDCESFSVREILDLEKGTDEKFNNLWLGYTETMGNGSLREAISTLYTETASSNIMVCAGAQEAIFIFINTLLDKGDHVIVQTPCYQSLSEVANSVGCTISEWKMKDERNWELQIEKLKDMLRENTRAIILNFPNNPTGAMISSKELNEIVSMAEKNGIYIFLDEVYRFLEYDEKDRLPSICDIYDKGVSLNVMSKSFGLPGLRIGWLATRDKKLMGDLAAFKDYTTICSSAPGEFLATIALHHHQKLLNRNKKIIASNFELLESFFTRFPSHFKWTKPIAGPLLFPKLLFTSDAHAFCMDLLDKKGVLLAPGILFNKNEPYIRIGMGRKNMPEALALLEAYLKELNK